MANNQLRGEALQNAVKNGLIQIGHTPTPKVVPSERPLSQPESDIPVSVVRFDLPPSVNNLFLNAKGGRRGRIRTPEYREWIAKHEKVAKTLRPPDKYPVRMCYCLCGKVFRGRDGYNCEKPLTDILVSVKVLEKDNLTRVTGGWWDYKPSKEEAHVLVWLEEIE